MNAYPDHAEGGDRSFGCGRLDNEMNSSAACASSRDSSSGLVFGALCDAGIAGNPIAPNYEGRFSAFPFRVRNKVPHSL